MKKRVVSLLLAVVMIVSLLPLKQAEAVTGSAFQPQWPVKQSKKITVLSHYSGGGPHNGVDIAGDGYPNQAIYPVAVGTVESVQNPCNCGEPNVGCNCGDTWGNYIVVRHTVNGTTYFSRYAHLLFNSITVKKGDIVSPEKAIAQMGSSGGSEGHHLHLEIYTGANEWDRKPQVQRTFDYYANNPSVIEGVMITTHNASDPNDYYYDWIRQNCTLKDGYYVVNKTDSLVRKTYPSYCQIKATAATTMMSLPCSNGTDAESVKVTDISKNATLTATALILNNQGNHWYKVTSSGGQTGYVPASKMSWVKDYTDDIKIKNHTNPPDITVGSRYTIQGTIYSTYNELTQVSAYVWKGTSVNTTPVTGDYANVSNNSYTLANSSIDMATYFNELAVGSYTYTVNAAYKSYYAVDEKTEGYHTGSVPLQTSTFNVSAPGHTHSWKVQYDSSNHWEACTSCSATRNTGSHSWYATYDSTYHWEECYNCPATKNKDIHEMNLTYNGDCHWYQCDGCDRSGSAISHFWSCKYDDTYHWDECVDCDATRNVVRHTPRVYGYTATEHFYCCSGCNLSLGSQVHAMGSWVASPTNSGMERRSCRGCDYYEERATVTRPSLHNPEHTRSCALPTLSWDSVPGAVKYSVNIGSPPYDSIGWITTTGTNAVDVGAVLGKTYCYSVTAYNSEGDILSYSEGIWYEYKHTEVTVPGQNPTCGKDGYTASSYCSECNTVLTPSTPRPATGQHNFVGGSCVVCGKPDPNAATTITFADIPTDSWQYPFAQYAVENGLMAGKGTDANGNIKFDPNSPIKREEFVQVLYNAEGKPTVTIPNIFPDVAAGGWYKNAVLWAKQNDIASGKGNGNFGVGENISRQDLAMMLYKYAKLNGYSLNAVNGLVDAYADGAMVADYARGAMNWAVTNGIMSGKGAAGAPLNSVRLDPTGIATRAECAAMLKNFRTAFGG